MGRALLAGVATAAVLLSGNAGAQGDISASIFSRGNFKGSNLTLSGPRQHLDPAFTARSIRISPGTAWEFCTGSTYTGCHRVDASVAGGVFTIRSARPIAPVLTTSTGVAVANQSLRGVASEFFVAPNEGGKRVGLPENSPERARQRADEFCRAAGWQMSAHLQLQSVGGSYYLVDVLCANGS